jgi:hypothetical protein
MNGNPNDYPIRQESTEPAWITRWRTKSAADRIVHVETKGSRKRTRRERRDKRK